MNYYVLLNEVEIHRAGRAASWKQLYQMARLLPSVKFFIAWNGDFIQVR